MSVPDPKSSSGPNTTKDETQIALELQLLKNLCASGLNSLSPEERNTLARHSWAAPDHRIIFDALSRLANISPAVLPHQLPAEATRMGFPDVAWDKFVPLRARDVNEPTASRNQCEPSPTTTELIAALRTLAAPNQSAARSK
jgi:hypothetical protein